MHTHMNRRNVWRYEDWSLPHFSKLVNPIIIRGQIMDPHKLVLTFYFTFRRPCIHTYTYDITKLYVCMYVVCRLCGNLLRVDLWPKTSKETMWRCTQVPLSQTLTPKSWLLSRKCICFDERIKIYCLNRSLCLNLWQIAESPFKMMVYPWMSD